MLQQILGCDAIVCHTYRHTVLLQEQQAQHSCLLTCPALSAPSFPSPASAPCYYRYCSVACQTAHFLLHKLVCPGCKQQPTPEQLLAAALVADL